MINSSDIKLFRSLFNGREDAYAIRWENGNKSGYMPSYHFDPYHYRVHSEIEFEVDNKEMRSEFEVVKPYFAKFHTSPFQRTLTKSIKN